MADPYLLDEPILHISGLPPSVTDDEIALVFQPCGNFRLKTERSAEGLQRFIEFDHLGQAEKAFACLRGKIFPGHSPPTKILLSPSSPTGPLNYIPPASNPCFLQPLHPDYTHFQLYDLLRPYGVLAAVNVPDPQVLEPPMVDFWHKDDASRAKNAIRRGRIDGLNLTHRNYWHRAPPAPGLRQRAPLDDSHLAGRPRLRRRGFKPPLITPPSNGIGDLGDLPGILVERSTVTADQVPTSLHDPTQEKQGVIGAYDCESPHALPGSSILVNFNVPTWKRFCSSAFPSPELISLAEAIFMSKYEVGVVCNLSGDDAQSFIDATHKVLDLPDLPSHLWGNCLKALCRICGRQALLPRSLQIPTCFNRLDKPLFQGGFADVWKGRHQGLDVAVKLLRVYSNSDIPKITSRFCKEVVTWTALRHPNVLPLLGVTMGEDQFAMVSEWMVGGNINQFVKAQREANRFELLQDVSKGLIYMHSQAMVHGDLKGANILIDQNGRARLADFGLLTIVSDPAYFTASSAGPTGGTTRWMSPELLGTEQFGLDDSLPTKESDCYALGMVIYEVLSGQIPFAHLRNHMVNQRVVKGERPERPEGAIGVWFEDDLWKFLNRCWAGQAQNRPSVEEVLGRLEELSITWMPLPPDMNEDVEMDESDWDTLLVTPNRN